jgi:hypothetical protein
MTDPDEISQHVVDQLPSVRAPRLTRLIWLLYVAVIALLAAVAFVYLRSAHTASEVDQAQRAAQQNAAALAQANDRIAHLGGVPVSTPAPGPSGPPGPKGEQGPGPSAEQIDLAVTSYCSGHDGCTGTPTRAEVASAVTAYCATGVCVGPSGSTGPSGAAGKNGNDGQTGAQGPGPTDDQVQAAVVAYCAAHSGCTGPAGRNGTDGSTGPQGPAGRGITSVDCTGIGVDHLTIHYSDGTTETVACAATTSSPAAPTGTPSGTSTP